MKKGLLKFSMIVSFISVCTISCVHEIPISSNSTGTGGAGTAGTSSCDTSKFLYSTTIAPLLLTNCVTCHSAGNPNNGGIDLSNFANAQAFALNGRL
ncbi:MAG: hypothetical protein NTZ19_03630, partial [Bacteroidetes bacterium]|nr:hypothetical protein [Bacteroidota bacterium]